MVPSNDKIGKEETNSGITALWNALSKSFPKCRALIRSSRDNPEPFSILNSEESSSLDLSHCLTASFDLLRVANSLPDFVPKVR